MKFLGEWMDLEGIILRKPYVATIHNGKHSEQKALLGRRGLNTENDSNTQNVRVTPRNLQISSEQNRTD